MSLFFSQVSQVAADPILGLNSAFLADTREEKINLSVGVYKDDWLQTPVLSAVKEAEKFILSSETTKNYLPIEGDSCFLQEVLRRVLQEDTQDLCSAQTVGGSGALRLGGDLLQVMGKKEIYIPKPSWLNHKNIFSQSGLQVKEYPYYDEKNKGVAFDRLQEFLLALPKESVILLHVNCHNPSGSDLTLAQWKILLALFEEKGHIPFFDAAYLGFDLSFSQDCFPIRLFKEAKKEFLLASSFAKNFSLYAERVGFFTVSSKEKNCQNVLSQLKALIRRNYSNPPKHGAMIVSTILQSPLLCSLWEEELSLMRKRIASMRNALVEELMLQGTKDYLYLKDKKGLFSFFSLTKEQVATLIQKYGIYMTEDGRMNVVGLTLATIPYVVQAIRRVGG